MSRHLSEDDLSDLFADERRRLTAEYEGEIAELRAEVDDLREQVKTLEPLRVVADALLDRVLDPIAKREPNVLRDVAHISLYTEPAKAGAVVNALLRTANATDLRTMPGKDEDLEPLRPVADVIHAELLRSDTVEYVPEVLGHSPAMLRIGRMVVSGMSAGALFEALRGFCLDFTDDRE